MKRLYDFGIHLGLAFQLQDDLLDGYGDTAVFGKKTGQDIRDLKKNYLILRALQLATPDQRLALAKLYNDTSVDEDNRVTKVMAIYETICLKPEIDKAITKEFDLAAEALEGIQVPEDLKTPLRELMESLNGRKK